MSLPGSPVPRWRLLILCALGLLMAWPPWARTASGASTAGVPAGQPLGREIQDPELSSARASAGQPLGRNDQKPYRSAPERGQPAWIYWEEGWEKSSPPGRTALSARAGQRLVRAGRDTTWADPTNRPAPREFLGYLSDRGIRIRTVSRSLRAVSAELTAGQIRFLLSSGEVCRIEPVVTFSAPGLPPGDRAGERRPGEFPGAPGDTLPDPRSLAAGDYGASFAQLEQIGVIDLHQRGFSGKGVLVCILDSGFDTGHQGMSLAGVAGTRDFVGGDDRVDWHPGDPDGPEMEAHGTGVWSVISGFRTGALIGAAYGASVLLGRTEQLSSETRFEEDTYVQGLEWADSMGADVVSTSLAYLSFDDGFAYPYEQLDGRTAVTTRAATWLARRGVFVATAMGNAGPGDGSLQTPADADSVCSVGSVDAQGMVAGTSSRGPSADGRIKPDLCACGVRTVCATIQGPDTYGSGSGTSFATPLIAGLAALLLEARPDWSAMDLLAALRGSADQAWAPDNTRGHGVPDGAAALEEEDPWIHQRGAGLYPNPSRTGEIVRLDLEMPGPGRVWVDVFDPGGRLATSPVAAAPVWARARLSWVQDLPSGIYWARIRFESSGSVASTDFSRRLVVLS